MTKSQMCGLILWYTFLVEIVFTESAGRHGFTREDAIHAITNAVGSGEIEGHGGEETHAFVGRPHPQADRYIEVLVGKSARGDLRIFHVMELSDLYRYLVE